MTAIGRLHEHAAAVGFIRHARGQSETRQRIKRAAHGRLSKRESFSKSADRVRSRFKRNAKKDCCLPDIQIRAISPNSLSKNIFKQGKRCCAVHDSSNWPAP